MKISFIGFGNMAKAIAKGLCQNKALKISAASPSLPAAVNSEGITTHFENLAIVKEANVLILAVKPANVTTVLAEIKPAIPKSCIVLSIAAGISLAKLADFCPPKQPIVRCMPNTPMAVGSGATALIANSFVTNTQKRTVEALFQYSGITAWVSKEAEMNAITALSGSGPAYVFLFIEAMINAAQHLGLDEELARDFALQTIAGAVSLMEKSNEKPEILRKKVTSPAGTTAAAIAILQQQKFEELIFSAMQAAYLRAEQLSTALT
ncbi:MAG: pyrroline-5-carboxylate reductase [Legionella sp.]|nr:pyrroline-5-carboxylate reductase [Legionella sp.]